jgi:hypothetical protein
MSVPKSLAKPQIELIFELPTPGLDEVDVGKFMVRFEFKGMVNGGYIIKGKLFDPNFNKLNELIDAGYFKITRTRPVKVRFQIRWGNKAEAPYPEKATKEQVAYLLSLKANGEGSADKAHLEFVAMDPPSWLLNMGDAAGKVYNGRVSDAIKKVVGEYAPGISLDISRTVDSPKGKWWMMRQDPKTFISSLFDWSSSITRGKTQWVFEPDGFNLTIKEQAELKSAQRAYYRCMDQEAHDTIRDWEFLADNALSVAQTKLITQGVSAISGQYLDRITDKAEKVVFVKDSRTPNKQVARIQDDQGFTKPPETRPQQVGWSSITTIPEVYSAGDIGIPYDQYIDGRPRAMWLNLVNALMRVKLECLGHGEWSSCKGLGIDTAFISWTSAKKSGSSKPFWWMTGNWIVYGFHHVVTRGDWTTNLYLARFDHDSIAKKVGR